MGQYLQIQTDSSGNPLPPPPSGKRPEVPAPLPQPIPFFSSHREQPATRSASSLCRATPGSTGLDLCASAHSILTPEVGVQVLSTGSFRPPLPHTYFLVLGRASTTLKGLKVHPSLIDNDYTREIKILVCALRGLVSIFQGQHLAQALPLPLDISHPAIGAQRGSSHQAPQTFTGSSQSPGTALYSALK